MDPLSDEVLFGSDLCLRAHGINLDEKLRQGKLNVGAVILGFGFEPFHGEYKGEYGLGRYKNVVSSIQYERMLSFTGPTAGLPGRPSDGRKPKKVAFIQNVFKITRIPYEFFYLRPHKNLFILYIEFISKSA